MIEGNLVSWPSLEQECLKPYYKELQSYLVQRNKQGAKVYPPAEDVFRAFRLTLLDQIKVVILGQDPYHGSGVAHGLAFSVKDGNRIPPSLRNIFKELHSDLGVPKPESGDLTSWSEQGVFLLNTILTVEEKSPGSHKNKGWETFTDRVISLVSDHQERVVFMLWGGFAKSKRSLVDENKHLVLEAPHPAAEVYAGGKAGFFGSKPFSKANSYLLEPVNWELV